MSHPLIPPTLKICEALQAQSDHKLCHELLVIDSLSVAVVVDIDGVDYIMTIMRVPKQRPRPTAQ